MLLSKPILLIVLFILLATVNHAGLSRTAQPPPINEPEHSRNNISLECLPAGKPGATQIQMYVLRGEEPVNSIPGNRLQLEPGSGTHTFYVTTGDDRSANGKALLKIRIDTGMPFYKTAWFWPLTGVLLFALCLAIYSRRKISRQRIAFRQQLALEQQRNKLTDDLHDDIGASLSSLQVNSAVAGQLIHKNPDHAREVLERIETQSRSLAEKISDFIWSTKPGKEEFMTMSCRIRNFVHDILGATGMAYEIHIDAGLDALVNDAGARKNIVLITREAVNNAAKYSGAEKITIRLFRRQQHLHLLITDNGAGFHTGKKTGNGITNMRKRAEKLNGSFSISSISGEGTVVSATIPIAAV